MEQLPYFTIVQGEVARHDWNIVVLDVKQLIYQDFDVKQPINHTMRWKETKSSYLAYKLD